MRLLFFVFVHKKNDIGLDAVQGTETASPTYCVYGIKAEKSFRFFPKKRVAILPNRCYF
ncbi:hypothetical protein Pjdr2_4442 [Paenibacillus sp. JDR-2]|nr:hypothetical protein Pjdr2_4442 [Paenibacillus sp. JDR-2]